MRGIWNFASWFVVLVSFAVFPLWIAITHPHWFEILVIMYALSILGTIIIRKGRLFLPFVNQGFLSLFTLYTFVMNVVALGIVVILYASQSYSIESVTILTAHQLILFGAKSLFS